MSGPVFPGVRSHENSSSTHPCPSEKMFEQPCILNASSLVGVLSGTFNFFDVVPSPMAALNRMGVSRYSTLFLCFFVTDPFPTISAQDPLSATHRRLPVATSPSSEDSAACMAVSVLDTVSGTTFGETGCANPLPLRIARRRSRTSVVVRASSVVIQPFGLGTSLRRFPIGVQPNLFFDVDLDQAEFNPE